MVSFEVLKLPFVFAFVFLEYASVKNGVEFEQ